MFLKSDLLFLTPEKSVLELATGGFAQRILVLILEEQGRPEGQHFLAKVLSAAQLNLEKDTLFAEIQPGRPISVLSAVQEKQAASLLVFGLPLDQVGIRAEIPKYTPYPFYGTQVLWADALSVLEPDKKLKTLLWQALQQMYLK